MWLIFLDDVAKKGLTELTSCFLDMTLLHFEPNLLIPWKIVVRIWLIIIYLMFIMFRQHGFGLTPLGN